MKRKPDLQSCGALIAFAAVFAVAAATSLVHDQGVFLRSGNLLNILRQVSYTGIVAIGMTFVILAGGIDLSVGSLVALSGGLSILAMNALGDAFPFLAANPWTLVALGTLAGVVAGAAGGAANGALVTFGRVVPFIATLGTMAIFRSLALYFSGAGEFQSSVEAFADFGMAYWLGLPTPVWAFLFLAVLGSVLLHLTRFGRHVLAVGANERVATFAAISVRRVRFLTYLLAGAASGLSAALLSARMNSISSTTGGLNYELDAIAAVIIGGTSMSGGRGTVWGTVLGAIILGIVNNMLNLVGVSPYLQGAAKGLVIICAVLVQRPGAKSAA